MRLGFIVLFVYTVAKSYAHDPSVWRTGFWIEGDDTEVTCVNTPTSSISLTQSTGWDEDNVYPLQVCVTTDAGIQTCPESEKSYISLILYNPGASPNFEVNLTEKFLPKDIKLPRKEHCVVFKASSISTACANQNLKDIRVRVKVVLFAKPPDDTSESFLATLGGAPHLLDSSRRRVISNRNPKHTLHSVICTIPNCAVAATQPVEDPLMTERFTIREGQAPKYEEGDGPLTDKMFSVTYFECEEGKCPTVYSATDVTMTKSNNVTIGASGITTKPSMATKDGGPVALIVAVALGTLMLLEPL